MTAKKKRKYETQQLTEKREDVVHLHSMGLLTEGRERHAFLLLKCMISELCCLYGDHPHDL